MEGLFSHSPIVLSMLARIRENQIFEGESRGKIGTLKIVLSCVGQDQLCGLQHIKQKLKIPLHKSPEQKKRFRDGVSSFD